MYRILQISHGEKSFTVFTDQSGNSLCIGFGYTRLMSNCKSFPRLIQHITKVFHHARFAM